MKAIAYAIMLITIASLSVHGAENTTAENETFFFGDATNETPYIATNETRFFWDETNNTLYSVNATNETVDTAYASLDGVLLREGDILFGGNNGGRGATDTGHVGILVEDNGQLVVREAHPYDYARGMDDGVQNRDIDHFVNRRGYGTICAYKVDVDDDTARAAANKAKEFSGSYCLCTGNDLAHWYCSELVYKAYKLGPGINLDESFTDPRCKWYNCLPQKKCAFVSPCDLIKGEKLINLRCWNEGFDCGIRWQGC